MPCLISAGCWSTPLNRKSLQELHAEVLGEVPIFGRALVLTPPLPEGTDLRVTLSVRPRLLGVDMLGMWIPAYVAPQTFTFVHFGVFEESTLEWNDLACRGVPRLQANVRRKMGCDEARVRVGS